MTKPSKTDADVEGGDLPDMTTEASRKINLIAESPSQPLKRRDRVVWVDQDGFPEPGIVKWLGVLEGTPCAGLKLDSGRKVAFGKHTGKKLYPCKTGTRAIVPVPRILRQVDYQAGKGFVLTSPSSASPKAKEKSVIPHKLSEKELGSAPAPAPAPAPAAPAEQILPGTLARVNDTTSSSSSDEEIPAQIPRQNLEPAISKTPQNPTLLQQRKYEDELEFEKMYTVQLRRAAEKWFSYQRRPQVARKQVSGKSPYPADIALDMIRNRHFSISTYTGTESLEKEFGYWRAWSESFRKSQLDACVTGVSAIKEIIDKSNNTTEPMSWETYQRLAESFSSGEFSEGEYGLPPMGLRSYETHANIAVETSQASQMERPRTEYANQLISYAYQDGIDKYWPKIQTNCSP